MLDLNFIREHPAEVKEALRKLHTDAPIDAILQYDEERRQLLTESEALRARRNAVSKEMGTLQRQLKKAQGAERERLQSHFAEMREEMRQVGERIKAIEERINDVEAQLRAAMLEVPNLPHESVPPGADESENVVVRTEGEPRAFDFEPLPHWDLGPMLGIIDFERGVKIAGTRFYVLKGWGARLQRALVDWMLDLHVNEHGYTEVYPPFLVKQDCMWGAGQFPKFRENVYYDTEDDLYLVPTAEVPLTNLHRDEVLEPGTLPLYYVAHSPCFRREKMSAGRDTRGIKRVHQFDKVEMYKFVEPHTSYDELEAMVNDAEDVCRRLNIPHRVVQMCTGDLGFQAAKKYDVEMWAPGCQEWLEVSSISNCEAFQARRANIRYRPAKGEKPQFVHTLNGSGLALPRVIIAIMENYQQADGSIVVPEVLRPYMGGITVIK
ncbi:MAG: serine--tRNA ligase [Anaerolineae bacterium]|nr:serine--tRNA ligase [Anaerolineae bacterium]